MSRRILLTGVTGRTGSAVASALSASGLPFCCMVRSLEAGARARARGYDTVEGDLEDRASLDRALGGRFDAVCLVSRPDERLVERECRFIDAARAAGVGQVVLVSAHLAALDAPCRNLRDHALVEAHLRGSGLAWTALRPQLYMQTFVAASRQLLDGAGVYLHAAGDGALPLVDARDVGAAAARLLTEGGFVGQSLELTGPEALSFGNQAKILSNALGRPVSYVAADEADLRRMFAQLALPLPLADRVSTTLRLCREGALREPAHGLARVGIAPTPFTRFAADFAGGRAEVGSVGGAGWSGALAAQAASWRYRAQFALFGRPA